MNNIITESELFNFALSLKVLYVEDNEETREMVQILFEDIFGSIVVATDGEDGLSKFDDSINLVITDINMPKLNGIEMLKKIREQNKFVDTMVISAHNNTSYFTQTIEIGVDGYLLKPIELNSFNRSLLGVLEKIYFKYELKNHKKMLETKVSEQIKELEQKDKALIQQSKLAAMGEIIDIVAHQWKQPLNLISLRTSYFEEVSIKENNIKIEDIQQCTADIYRQVKYLSKTIDEFRNFLRPNTNMNICDLSKLFEVVRLLLKDDMMHNMITLNTNCTSNLNINANENELKHIFINLINNSKDAFNLNKIKSRDINIEAHKAHNSIKITYKDNAGGIPNDIINNIFEPHVTTKGESGGTGIGLYLVKMIVDKYNGIIEVKNEPDGACFGITF